MVIGSCVGRYERKRWAFGMGVGMAGKAWRSGNCMTDDWALDAGRLWDKVILMLFFSDIPVMATTKTPKGKAVAKSAFLVWIYIYLSIPAGLTFCFFFFSFVLVFCFSVSPETGAKELKAKSAKKAALQGAHAHAARKTRFSVSFHRPKTLKLAREPKYPRKSIPHAPRMDQFRTIVSCVFFLLLVFGFLADMGLTFFFFLSCFCFWMVDL